jgi:alpha-D-ribose 1-methylphosphonate 5-triphosphate diphosphatase PhnM
MLKRTGWIFVFLILLGLFGLAATIDVGSALPITQSDHGAALGAVPGNLVLLANDSRLRGMMVLLRAPAFVHQGSHMQTI